MTNNKNYMKQVADLSHRDVLHWPDILVELEDNVPQQTLPASEN